jgi:hypothetical protein
VCYECATSIQTPRYETDARYERVSRGEIDALVADQRRGMLWAVCDGDVIHGGVGHSCRNITIIKRLGRSVTIMQHSFRNITITQRLERSVSIMQLCSASHTTIMQ